MVGFLFLFLIKASAQNNCPLHISLLTCAPGAELYSTFGHTAIRVQDSSTALDEVYNYGTFEFSDDFYAKFVRGKLLYALSVSSFPDFIYQYQVESRSVVQQELNLTCAQKLLLHQKLRQNAAPEARSYRYDFLFDNCTTRARDMIDTGAGAKTQLGDILKPQPLTFRDHITVYLNRAHQDWSKLGIDLLLGAKMDRPATNREAMFLPDNLLAAFDGATIEGRPLVAARQTILNVPSLASASYFFTPLVSFSVLLLLAVLLSFGRKQWAMATVKGFDFVLFLLSGLVGFLLVFMWTGTDHALCANNYNLLWALPTNALAAFFVHKKSGRIRLYFSIVFCVMVLTLALWAVLPQDMNEGFLPLVIALALRSGLLAKQSANGNKDLAL